MVLYFNKTQSTERFILIKEDVIIIHCMQNYTYMILCTGKHYLIEKEVLFIHMTSTMCYTDLK